MIEHWLTTGWKVHQWKSTTDTWGGPIEGYSTSGVAINSRFRQLSGDRIIRDDANNVITDAKFYVMPTTWGLKEGDQFRKGDLKFEVTFVHDPMDMDRFLQVEAKKV